MRDMDVKLVTALAEAFPAPEEQQRAVQETQVETKRRKSK